MLCFGINVYKEPSPLNECLSFLRECYSTAPVVVIADGADGATREYEAICKEYLAKFYQGEERLRVWPNGGHWWNRLLSTLLFEYSGVEWYVKMDPDTRVMRKLSYLPDADLFGFMRVRTDDRRFPLTREPFITTAFVGIRNAAARRLLDSGELLNETYRSAFYNMARYTGEDLSIGSWILHDAAKALGLTRASHPEVYLQWRETVPVQLWSSYAVVNVERKTK